MSTNRWPHQLSYISSTSGQRWLWLVGLGRRFRTSARGAVSTTQGARVEEANPSPSRFPPYSRLCTSKQFRSQGSFAGEQGCRTSSSARRSGWCVAVCLCVCVCVSVSLLLLLLPLLLFTGDALELGQIEWRLQDVLAQEHRARVR